jgi:hypothetical protein
MQSKKYPSQKGGRPRIEISWEGTPTNCKHVVINFDGEEIGTISNQKMMEEGQWFTTQYDTILGVKLKRNPLIDFIGTCKWEISMYGDFGPGLHCTRQKLESISSIVFFIAGFNISVGLVVTLFKVEPFGSTIGGIFMIIFGFVFLGLGFLVSRRSEIALGTAFTLFLLDTIFLAYYQIIELPTQARITGATYSLSPPFWLYIIHAILLYWAISLCTDLLDHFRIPQQNDKSASSIIFFIAGFNISVGLAVTLFKDEPFGGIFMIIFGFVFLGLGFLVKPRSEIALGTAFTLFLLDTIFLVYYQIIELPTQARITGAIYSSSPSFFLYIVHAILLYVMWQGFGAIRKLKIDRNDVYP